MKYKARAVSMKHINQTEEILVWFKGPILYKTAIGKRKLVFPWNVKKINLSNQTFFPVTFWGIRGSQKLKIEEVSYDVIKWNPDADWTFISKYSNLDNLNQTIIIDAIHQAIPESIEPLNIFKEKTNIKFTIPDILDTTKEVIPQSILNTKN